MAKKKALTISKSRGTDRWRAWRGEKTQAWRKARGIGGAKKAASVERGEGEKTPPPEKKRILREGGPR